MDREVRISDITMKRMAKEGDGSLSFKEKIELGKLLDRLGAAVIEIEGITQPKMDALRIKSIAAAVKNSVVAAPVTLDKENADAVWAALSEARRPRLQVLAAVSPMQMEYIYHKKPAAMLETIREMVSYCAAKTDNVEFIADDAARADEAFLAHAVRTAIEAGAATVTLCDAAGNLLPEEFRAFVERVREAVPETETVTLGVAVDDGLSLADACLIAAVAAGARELKAAAYPVRTASLQNVGKVLADRGETFGVYTTVRTVELRRITQQIDSIFRGEKGKAAPAEGNKAETEHMVLYSYDDREAVLKAAAAIGYELGEEDAEAVWNAFRGIAERREQIDMRELDAIVAAAAMQVPPTYLLKSYVITSGNLTKAMATVVLLRDEMEFEGTAPGDGPVDAAFKALELAADAHYELDEFQIRAVTEGRGAMGETVVRLLHNGKLYGGRGISTDIVGASIGAYVSALNKIAYEEAQTV